MRFESLCLPSFWDVLQLYPVRWWSWNWDQPTSLDGWNYIVDDHQTKPIMVDCRVVFEWCEVCHSYFGRDWSHPVAGYTVVISCSVWLGLGRGHVLIQSAQSSLKLQRWFLEATRKAGHKQSMLARLHVCLSKLSLDAVGFVLARSNCIFGISD